MSAVADLVRKVRQRTHNRYIEDEYAQEDLPVSNWLIIGPEDMSQVLNTMVSAMSQTKATKCEPRRLTLDEVDGEEWGFSCKMAAMPAWRQYNFEMFLELLKCVVVGKIRAEDRITTVTPAMMDDYRSRPTVPFKDQKHVIIVALPATNLSPELLKELARISAIFEQSAPLMVLLNDYDKVHPQAALHTLAKNPSLRAKTEQLRKSVQSLPASHVRPFVTCGGKAGYQNAAVDTMALTVIDMAVSRTEEAFGFRYEREEKWAVHLANMAFKQGNDMASRLASGTIFRLRYAEA